MWRAHNARNMPDELLRKAARVIAFTKRQVPALPIAFAPQGFFGDDAGFTLARPDARQRFSFADWDRFSGICGHQHVPENGHWDPGAINTVRLGQLIHEELGQPTPGPTPPPPPPPAPAPGPHVPPFPGVVKRGSRGNAVRQVQQRLKDRGWKVTVDGVFGAGTDTVVRAFQREKRLVADGVVGPRTWNALWTAPVR